jgi:hypothetical protein
VTCRDVEDALLRDPSGAALPPGIAAHIAGCEPCRQLVASMTDASEDAAPGPARLKQIEAAILAGLEPVRPVPSPRSSSLMQVLLLLIVVGAGAAVFGTSGWSALTWTQRLAMFTTLAAGMGLLGFSSARQVVPGAAVLVPPSVAVVGVVVVIASLVAVLFQPRPDPAFVSHGLKCLALGLVCALASGVPLWRLLARAAILQPTVTGATAGVLAGLAGLAVLEIHCPNLDVAHIVTWHLGALLASAATGMAIGAVAEHIAPGRRPRW